MNYVILNYPEDFQDIKLKNFKEVDLFGEERVDAVFCRVTKHLLETIDILTDGGDTVFPGSWLLKDAGIFVLLKIDRDILLDDDTQFIEKTFGLLDQEGYFIELRGLNIEESYNQIEQYIIAYRKELGFVENFCPESTEKNSLDYILKEIEEKIL